MSNYIVWWLVGFGLVIVELLTGTFYVLMIALAAGAGGVAAFLGLNEALQFVIAAAVGAGATFLLRRSRLGKINQSIDPSLDPNQTLDIGQTVHVREWNNGTARVTYRGSQWNAVLAPGQTEAAGTFYIHEVRGTQLTLSSQRP
ncbi:MAG TPA: NfeD family protein [Burkholderiaceae bacterium]|nr:NfeD family protein [Burkholderiaceae bacterium]